jgi:hypothetical protein
LTASDRSSQALNMDGAGVPECEQPRDVFDRADG